MLKLKDFYYRGIGPVNIELKASECIGIMGASGAGKSIFLRAVADMDPYEGEMSISGIPSIKMPAHIWRKRVGLMPAESSWWHGTVREHFKTTGIIEPEELGLEQNIMDREILRLSSGEKQRLSLLRLLSNSPEILLLDEPTANLDPENTRRVEELILQYISKRSAAAFWVSHDSDQIARVSNRLLVIEGNKVREKKGERLA